MKHILVKCGPYYWVVSSGRNIVKAEREEGEIQGSKERDRDREQGEGSEIALSLRVSVP